jgi:hypothetical protein
MQAPTAMELLDNPTVREALEQAWLESQPGEPASRHEEGGWIYMAVVSGEIVVRRAPRGGQAAIDLSQPPMVDGSVVVAKFHTHPNPSAEGWTAGPSEADLVVDAIHGVPDLIRADNGVHVSGPNERRGGLIGNPGYPA